jgi:serine/threonine protein kinase
VDLKPHFLSDEWRHDLHSGVSPEVLLGNRADARADVWSCGIMLLQLLSKNLDIVGATAPSRTYGELLFGFLAHLLPRADIAEFVRQAPMLKAEFT